MNFCVLDKNRTLITVFWMNLNDWNMTMMHFQGKRKFEKFSIVKSRKGFNFLTIFRAHFEYISCTFRIHFVHISCSISHWILIRSLLMEMLVFMNLYLTKNKFHISKQDVLQAMDFLEKETGLKYICHTPRDHEIMWSWNHVIFEIMWSSCDLEMMNLVALIGFRDTKCKWYNFNPV